MLLQRRQQSGLSVVKWFGRTDRRTVLAVVAALDGFGGATTRQTGATASLAGLSDQWTAETDQAMIKYPAKRGRGEGVLVDHGACSSGRPGTLGGSGTSHAASQKGWRALRVHRHSAARVSVTQLSAACIRKSPRRRKGPRSTARMVAGTSGCSLGIPWCLVVQGPGRAAADDLGYQRRARGVRGDPGPLPGIEHLRKPAEALGEMPASLRVEVHSDLTALVGLPRPWPG